jgi:hypothetical protein
MPAGTATVGIDGVDVTEGAGRGAWWGTAI